MTIENKRGLEVVVKYGSSCLVNGDRDSQQELLDDYADALSIVSQTRRLAIVTSGSVALGRQHYEDLYASDYYEEDREKLESKQVFAAMGSAGITEMWRQALIRHGLLSGQVLVTHSELKTDEAEKLRQTYREMGGIAIPVINQNDALVMPDEEDNELNKLGVEADNDWLAADVARCLGAKTLILCTSDVDGMEVGGTVQHEIKTSEVSSLFGHCYEPSEGGSGGMHSKLSAAAWWANQSAEKEAYICNANADLEGMLAGADIGTQVVQ